MTVNDEDIDHFITVLDRYEIDANYDALRVELQDVAGVGDESTDLVEFIVKHATSPEVLLSKAECELFDIIRDTSSHRRGDTPTIVAHEEMIASLLESKRDHLSKIEQQNTQLQELCTRLEMELIDNQSSQNDLAKIATLNGSEAEDTDFQLSHQTLMMHNDLASVAKSALGVIDGLSPNKSEFAFQQRKLLKKMMLRDDELMDEVKNVHNVMKEECVLPSDQVEVNKEINRLVEAYSAALYDDLSATTSTAFNETLLQSFQEEKLRRKLPSKDERDTKSDTMKTQMAKLLADVNMENVLIDVARWKVADPIQSRLQEWDSQMRQRLVEHMRRSHQCLLEHTARLQIIKLIFDREMVQIADIRGTVENLLEELVGLVESAKTRLEKMQVSKVHIRADGQLIGKHDHVANGLLELMSSDSDDKHYQNRYSDLLESAQKIQNDTKEKAWDEELKDALDKLNTWKCAIDHLNDTLHLHSKTDKIEWNDMCLMTKAQEVVGQIPQLQKQIRDAQQSSIMDDRLKKRQTVFNETPGGVLRRHFIVRTIGRRLETTQAGPIPTPNLRTVPRGRRIAANLLLSSGVFAIGAGLGLSFAPYINPYSSSEPLYITSDWNDPKVKALTETLEEQLQSLSIVQKLKADPKWRASRPYSKLDMEERAHHMTAYALAGPGKIGVTPQLFVDENNTSLVAIIHVGKSLCGHKGFIHGGLLATLLDESMGRIALPNLPSQLGVTANLDVNYRLPTKAEQFIVAKTELKKVEGRKCWVEGRLETLDGKVLVDAKALFVEPKYAKVMAPIMNVVM